MVVYVANPLYDAVFKYLMEDDRIAKTILAALLKKKVIDVKIREMNMRILLVVSLSPCFASILLLLFWMKTTSRT